MDLNGLHLGGIGTAQLSFTRLGSAGMNSVGLGLAWLRHAVFACDWFDSVDSAGLSPTGLASVKLS